MSITGRMATGRMTNSSQFALEFPCFSTAGPSKLGQLVTREFWKHSVPHHWAAYAWLGLDSNVTQSTVGVTAMLLIGCLSHCWVLILLLFQSSLNYIISVWNSKVVYSSNCVVFFVVCMYLISFHSCLQICLFSPRYSYQQLTHDTNALCSEPIPVPWTYTFIGTWSPSQVTSSDSLTKCSSTE